MAKILITGASGFLGRNLIEEIRNDFEIIPLVYKSSERLQNMGRFEQIIQCDLTDFESVKKNLENVDFDLVLHLAGFVYPSFDYESGHKSLQNNITATFNLLEAVKEKDFDGLIFSSTTDVYGNVETPYRETSPPQPATFYGLTKLTAEYLVRLYSKKYNFNHLIIRFSNMYGRYQPNDKIIPTFIAKAKNNTPIDVYSPETKRDFLFVKDACKLIRRVIADPTKLNNEIYNCSSGTGIRIIDIVETVIKLTKSRSVKNIQEKHERAVVKESIASNEKARRKFSWWVETSFEDGVKTLIDYF